MAEFSKDDPRMRGFRSRLSVESVDEIIDARTVPLGSELIPLSDAANRVLAETVVARRDVPSFDRSAMDGFAIRGEETFGADLYNPAVFRLIGRSRPGESFEGFVGPGQAVAIATGAPIPNGADAVAKVESSRLIGETVAITEPTPPLRNIGRTGEDIVRDTIIFETFRILRPQDLGVLSALGFAEVSVISRPRVTILITGDEIDPAGSLSEPYRIPDMNGPMLVALVARDGGTSRLVGPLRDDRDSLRAAMVEARESSDFLIVSGGSSTGPEDHAPSLVAELGELAIHGVAIRPASPTGVGFLGDMPILLAPGNPVSCLCAYDFFGGQIVRKLGERKADWPYRSTTFPLAEKLSSCLGRVDYVRVKILDRRVVPLATSGASILSSTTRADGFVVVPSPLEGYAAGDDVCVWFYEV